MSELDKYFEKARNVEPIYEEDDAKKLLAGKLSDGGIATNLLNKIKEHTMITTLIASVVAISSFALMQFANPNTQTKPNKIAEKTANTQLNEENDESENSYENKENAIITYDVMGGVISSQNTSDKALDTIQNNHKEVKEQNKANEIWTDNDINLKKVNLLKLTKDELKKLGIIVNENSFKVNAFDRYTYTINQNNEKVRDYYNKDEDHDALPTPAMITTSTGYKTLTLFKKGNVEAVVDRMRTVSENGGEINTNTEKIIKTEDADIDIKLNKVKNGTKVVSSNSKMDYMVDGDTLKIEYKKQTDTSERKLTMFFPKEKFKNFESHKKRLDKIINSFDDIPVTTEFSKKDPNERKDTLLAKIDLGYIDSSFFDKSFDVVGELVNALTNNPDSSYILNHINRIKGINIYYQNISCASDFQQIIDKDSHKFDFDKYHLRDEFTMELDTTKIDNSNYYKTFKISWWGYPDFFDEKELVTNQEKNRIMKDSNVTKLNGTVVDKDGNTIQREDSPKNQNTIITEIYEQKDDNNFSTNNKLDSIKNKIFEMKIGDKTVKVNINDIIKDGKLDQNKYKELILENTKNINKNINIDLEKSGSPDKKIERYQLNINKRNNTDTKNSLFDNFNYNINELIPIEISFDGKKTDFIVWYEATDDFLKKLPPNIIAKINPELAAINEQTEYCDNAPIEKNDAVMDVWSGCSGAIKNMRVFPNPATNSSKVEFNLEDSRMIWIAVYDLSGKLIKSLYKAVEYKKGNFDENLNLNGITPGMYYVLVKSEKGEQALQRIIIE